MMGLDVMDAEKRRQTKNYDRYCLFFFSMWKISLLQMKCPFFSLVASGSGVRGCSGNNGDEENAEDRSYCVHQRQEVILLRSCLCSKNQGDHQETHGKEMLTKGVVLKHVKAVATVSEREATFQNFSNSVEVTSQSQKKRIACESSDVLCCQLPPLLPLPPFLILFSSTLPHTPPMPTQHTPTPLFPFHPPLAATRLHHHHHTPPTPAVHTLRPPRNVGPRCTFEVVALFSHHHC